MPLGGFPTRALFYQPRFGMAYDLSATARPCSAAVGAGSTTTPASSPTASTSPRACRPYSRSPATIGGVPLLAKQPRLRSISRAQALSPAAVDSKDDKQAYTDSYSFTISQRMPWSSLLEVGLRRQPDARHPELGQRRQLGHQQQQHQPGSGRRDAVIKNGGVDPNTLNANNFRPLQGFSDLYLATNNGYANYNALQVTWARTKGRYTINLNYTFGKAMGIVGLLSTSSTSTTTTAC